MRVLAAILLVFLAPQDPKLRELIQRLEDDRVEAREQAQKDLAALGDAALPALQEVLDSEQSSGELKLRAAAAMRMIELAAKMAKVYFEPARVTLQCADTTLGEVLGRVSRQAGVKIDASSVDGQAKSGLEVQDAPLMEVLDRLCKDRTDRSWEWRDDGTIRMLSDRHVAFPSVCSGPFRIRVQSMNAERSTDFKAATVTLTVTLQADWDRRLKPSRIVDLEVSRAVDSLGTALDVTPWDMNNIFRGPGVQLRVGVGLVQDGAENSRGFLLRGVSPAAKGVDLEGTARFSFPLDLREVKIEKPGLSENKDLGDTVVRINHNGSSPENWNVSFHKAPSAPSTGWARSIGQRFDPDSFVVVDQDGAEFSASLRSMRGGRQFADAANEVGIWYQGLIQRTPGKAIKEVKFKFVEQTLVKPVGFKFTGLLLP